MVQKDRENEEPSCRRARRTRQRQPGPECMCSGRPTAGGLGAKPLSGHITTARL